MFLYLTPQLSALFAKHPYRSQIKTHICHEQLTVPDLSVDVSSSLSQPHQAVSMSSARCAVCWGVLEVAGCSVHLTSHLHQTHKALQLVKTQNIYHNVCRSDGEKKNENVRKPHKRTLQYSLFDDFCIFLCFSLFSC